MGNRNTRKSRTGKKTSITLSKKHGVNPTIPICFWCQNEKNEVAMLGKLPGDVEAPRSMWIPGDYEPCDECKKMWEGLVRIVEAYETPKLNENQPAYYGAYSTGRYVMVKPEAIEKIFTNIDLEYVKQHGICFIDHEGFEKLIELPRGENTAYNEGREE